MLLQHEKACFTSETAVKYAFFAVLSVFWKMSIAEKAVYSPAAALCPFCRVRADRGRKTRSEMSFLGSGKMEQKLKDSLQDLHEVPEHLWSARKRRRSALCDALLDKEAPSGRIEELKN